MTVGWARFCAHADTKPRGQTINLSAHPTLFSENKFTLLIRTRLMEHHVFLIKYLVKSITYNKYPGAVPIQHERHPAQHLQGRKPARTASAVLEYVFRDQR